MVDRGDRRAEAPERLDYGGSTRMLDAENDRGDLHRVCAIGHRKPHGIVMGAGAINHKPGTRGAGARATDALHISGSYARRADHRERAAGSQWLYERAYLSPRNDQLTETRKPSLVLGVQRDQFQQRPGIAGLDDVVVVGARLGEDSVPALDALPAYSDQHGAFAGPVLANLSGSIQSISIRHRYVHDYYVGIEVPNVHNDGARAVDALGVVPMALKQVQQGIVRVLIVVHNENTGAVRHGEKNTGMGGAPHASLDLMRPWPISPVTLL